MANKNRTFRIKPSLDRLLIAAAAKSGRSVSEEIERHLERSFDLIAVLEALHNRTTPTHWEWPPAAVLDAYRATAGSFD